MTKDKNGITLIALVITIIVLLILSSVTIKVIIDDNGVINKAVSAKENSEISKEKESINLAMAELKINDNNDNIDKNQLKNELKKLISKNSNEKNVDVIVEKNQIEVDFWDNNRIYYVENENIILEKYIANNFPGDISKGEKYDGTKEKPYRIYYIEDLLKASIMHNGGSKELGIASKKIDNSYIILERNLNFKSKLSYENYKTKIYGDVNCNGVIEELFDELNDTTITSQGFIPFSNVKNLNFDGNNKSIRNLYINKKGTAGLFLSLSDSKITNLNIKCQMISSDSSAGGLACFGKKILIDNCKLLQESRIISSENQLPGEKAAGGFCGSGYLIKIQNSYIFENTFIQGKNAGSFIGFATSSDAKCEIYNSGALAQVSSYKYLDKEIGGNAGGLVGYLYSGHLYIVNSYFAGEILSGKYMGGILGGFLWFDNNDPLECYYVGSQNLEGNHGRKLIGINKIEKEEIKGKIEFVEKMNSFKSKWDIIGEKEKWPIDWKKWQYLENKFPIV